MSRRDKTSSERVASKPEQQGRGRGRALRQAARPLQVGVQPSAPFPAPQWDAVTITFLKQISEPVTLLFKSLHCHPGIKSKVLGLAFTVLHNRATTFLQYLSLKMNYCCLLQTHHFCLSFLSILFHLPGMPITIFLQSHPPQLQPTTHVHAHRGTHSRCRSSSNATFSLKSFSSPI